MKVLIVLDQDGGEAVLTNESAGSRYSFPILEITADDIDGNFGPSDLIGEPPKLITAAQVVVGWATQPDRLPEEIEFARRFLSQWPEGPQIADA